MFGVLEAILHLDLVACPLGFVCTGEIPLVLLPCVAGRVSRPMWRLRSRAAPAAQGRIHVVLPFTRRAAHLSRTITAAKSRTVIL
jgi:hypothetical protein